MPTFHTQAATPEQALEILSRLARDVPPRVGIVLFNIQHDIQAHNIHQLERSFGRLQHSLEDGVNLLGCRDAFRGREEGFSLDRGPNTESR